MNFKVVHFYGLLFFCFGIFVSCTEGHQASSEFLNEIPIDESTISEKNKIQKNILRIEELARSNGYLVRFNTIPILVSAANPNTTHWWGLCVKNELNESLYIIVNKVVFKKEQYEPWSHFIFGVLLHEIGHCYFNRGHDKQLLKKEGFTIHIIPNNSPPGTELVSNEYPVTIMYTDPSRGGNPYIGIPEQLENYFVMELFGLKRFSSIDELVTIQNIFLIKAN